MALKHYNPTSPAQRGLILVDKSHLHKGKPVKALTEGKRKTGGRNNKGHVTSRGIAGGHKQRYRIIDFKRRKWDMEGTVERLEYDPNRTAFIALVKYEDGEQAYIIAPQRLAAGDKVIAGKKADVKPGNAMECRPDAGRHDLPQHRDEAGQGWPDRPFGRHLRSARRS
jgi:large subunit ribosomal protein L2